jgi:hypothetical protein
MWFRLICFLIALLISAGTECSEKEKIKKEHELLESELKLASKPNIYFIFDLENRKIYFKARGAVLRELRIEDVKLWGDAVAAKPHSLLKKSTFFKPRRSRIKKGDSSTGDEFKIDALELEDMPVHYTLYMDEGISIFIRPKSEGLFSWVCNIAYLIKRYVSRPVFTVLNTLRGKPFTAIDVVLDKKDAQALYWVFSEGSEGIINM